MEIHGERWDFIASHFPDRADVQCQHRWSKVVNPELVKGKDLLDFRLEQRPNKNSIVSGEKMRLK